MSVYGAWLLVAGAALAQDSPKLSFEAASVRSSKGVVPWSFAGGPGTNDPGQISYQNVTLWEVIAGAYDVRPYQLKGAPSWLDSERYTIVAKVRAGASKAEAREMMQTLLAERFRLAVHRETQDARLYNLVIDKGGPRLTAGTDGGPAERATLVSDGNGGLAIPERALGRPVTLAGKQIVYLAGSGTVSILGNSQPVSALAGVLSRLMDGPVRDATGLTGTYDFSFAFETPAGVRGPQTGPPGEILPGLTQAAEPLPTVFEVLKEKLGLRLEIAHGPVECLMVDRVDRAPKEN